MLCKLEYAQYYYPIIKFNKIVLIQINRCSILHKIFDANTKLLMMNIVTNAIVNSF